MKRIILSLLTLCTVVTGASAQFARPRLRVEIGANSSDVVTQISNGSLKESISLGRKVGLRAGVSAEIALFNLPKTKLYFAPGVNYRNVGFDYKMSKAAVEAALSMSNATATQVKEILNSKLNITQGTHSLLVPLHLGLGTSLAGDWFLAVEGGPYASYVLGQYAKTSIPYINASEIEDAKVGYEHKLQAGLSASVLLGYKRLFLRFAYERDLVSITKDDDVSQFNSVLGATIGFRF